MSVTDAPVSRPRNRRGEGDKLRVELLDAAAELLAEKGNVDAVSLRAVATQAGVSPTAVYRHFEDHTTLMTEAVRHCWQQFSDALDTNAAGVNDPFECFHLMGENYTRFAATEPGKYQVLWATRAAASDASAEAKETAEHANNTGMVIFMRLVDVVQQILDHNNDERDAFMVASLAHSWMHGIVGLCGHAESQTKDAPWPDVHVLMEKVSDYLWLRPRPQK